MKKNHDLDSSFIRKLFQFMESEIHYGIPIARISDGFKFAYKNIGIMSQVIEARRENIKLSKKLNCFMDKYRIPRIDIG